jgi:hypothetical protein
MSRIMEVQAAISTSPCSPVQASLVKPPVQTTVPLRRGSGTGPENLCRRFGRLRLLIAIAVIGTNGSHTGREKQKSEAGCQKDRMHRYTPWLDSGAGSFLPVLKIHSLSAVPDGFLASGCGTVLFEPCR